MINDVLLCGSREEKKMINGWDVCFRKGKGRPITGEKKYPYSKGGETKLLNVVCEEPIYIINWVIFQRLNTKS